MMNMGFNTLSHTKKGEKKQWEESVYEKERMAYGMYAFAA